MKAAILASSLLVLACSASDPGDGGGAGGGGASSAGSAGAPAGGGASGSAGMSGGGASAGGTPASAGSSAAGTSGASGASGGMGGGSAGGSAGATSGGTAGGSGCTPDPAGTFTVVGDVVVHDSKTCLDWARGTTTGVNYAAAQMACGDSTLGGFDDWRIPNVNELASTITACGNFSTGPVDTNVFNVQGDGYWTTTPAEDTVNQEGQPTHLCAVGMANAGGYYKYGPAGPQVVRCVRGAGTVKMVKDCKLADGCKNW